MLFGRLPYAVLHVIRIGYNETGSFLNQIIHQLGQRQAGSVGGVHFIKVEHLNLWQLTLNIKPGIIVSLTPPPVVEGTNQEHGESKRLLLCLLGAANSQY